jgi:hypothetical protein
MASCQPDEVKKRFREALNDGSLDSRQFFNVSALWRACNVICTGRVKNATGSSLTIEAMVDGRDWTIGLDPGTHIFRHGVQLAPSDLRPGEVVQASSQDGKIAQFVTSFAE